MKINNDAALQQALRTYSPKGNLDKTQGIGSAGEGGSSTDEISISPEGQTLQRVIQAANQASDIRAERIAEVRTQIRTGKYLLDPQQIANRMLGLGDE